MARVRTGLGWLLALPLALGALSGCATGPEAAENGDQLEPFNRAMYGFNEELDRILIGPIAEGYVAITPDPARTAITNFFDNIWYPWTVINQWLQGKFERGFEDAGRFMVNTTFGLGGLIDIATPMGLEKHDEDLGQTLAVWGMPEGVYLVLPVLGPNSFRDAPDLAARRVVNIADAFPELLENGLPVLNGINTRANLDSAIRVRERSALDPYVFTREAYRQRREFLIYDGDPPIEGFDTD